MGLASRRNRRAVGIQANPIPGEVWMTTFSTDLLTYVEFQLSSEANVLAAVGAPLLDGWSWNYWSTATGAAASVAVAEVQPIAGGLHVLVPDLPNWDLTQPWALVWPEGQMVIRGPRGQRLTGSTISAGVGQPENVGQFVALHAAAPTPPTDWFQQQYVTGSGISSPTQINLTFSGPISGFGSVSGWSYAGGATISSVSPGASPNEAFVMMTGFLAPGDILTITPSSGLVGTVDGYPVAPGAFRM
jgi:hypothetical protein